MQKLKKILIIEDDRDLSKLLQIDLAPIGETYLSTNWLDGKKRVDEMQFDLILLDMMLPDTAYPLEPLSYIHSLNQEYPVILMSGNHQLIDELMDQLMRLGLDKVLYKPYTKDELLERVEVFIQ